MEDKKISVLPDNAITELTKQVYSDLAHPILKEAGSMGAAVMKFVALPFKFLGLTSEELEEKYAIFLKNAINKVPKKDCVMPKGVVAAPLLDHVKFVFEEEGLVEMFSNLLANAMNSNVEKMVHPAFVEMLKQMSPLDVEFMYLYFRKKDFVELEEITWERGENQRNLTIDSLQRLGIINGVTYDNRDDVAIMLTNFGTLFRNLCMMTPTEITLDEKTDESSYGLENSGIKPEEIGFMFQDSFATARKSEINQRVYIRHTFRIEDILNGNNIIVLFRIYNICQQKQIIKSLYLESKDGKKIFADNSFPTLILPEKYSDFIFFATSENNLLQEVSKGQMQYILETDISSYEIPVTDQTKQEIKLYLKSIDKKGGDQDV